MNLSLSSKDPHKAQFGSNINENLLKHIVIYFILSLSVKS